MIQGSFKNPAWEATLRYDSVKYVQSSQINQKILQDIILIGKIFLDVGVQC